MIEVNIIEDVKKIEVTFENEYSIFFLSRSRIELTQSRFK